MTEFPRDAILVVVETRASGELEKAAAGLFGAAAAAGTPIALVLASPGAGSAAAAEAAALGAARVLIAETPDPSALGVPGVDALAAAVEQVQPDAILISHSLNGRDLAGRYAARSRAAVSADAIGVSRDDEGVVAHHSVYGGAYNVTSTSTFGAPVITVRQGSIEARAAAQPPASETLAVTPSGKPAARIDSFEEAVAATSRPELRGAAKVVAGGRGLGSEEQFALVGQLADTLGAAVGASRAAVDAGYIPQSASGRPDRGFRVITVVYRAGHFRCDPAPGRHADREDDRRHQQGRQTRRSSRSPTSVWSATSSRWCPS